MEALASGVITLQARKEELSRELETTRTELSREMETTRSLRDAAAVKSGMRVPIVPTIAAEARPELATSGQGGDVKQWRRATKRSSIVHSPDLNADAAFDTGRDRGFGKGRV